MPIMEYTLQTLGVVGQVAGIALIYLHWRKRQAPGATGLVAGWALLLLGALPWLFNVSVERGLAIAMLAPMVAGMLLCLPNGLADIKGSTKGQTAKNQAAREAVRSDTKSISPGRLSRNIARWVGSLIVAPAFAIAAMAAWQAFMPGSVVNRASFSIFALIIAWTLGLLWLLASTKPWRVVLMTCFGAVALGGGILILPSAGVV